MTIREQLEDIRARANGELGDNGDADAIENVRVRVLGRNGELTAIMRGMREIAPEERRAVGQLLNEIKTALEKRIEELVEKHKRAELEKSLAGARLDVTLPGMRVARGHIHPVTAMVERMLDIFVAMGFEV